MDDEQFAETVKTWMMKQVYKKLNELQQAKNKIDSYFLSNICSVHRYPKLDNQFFKVGGLMRVQPR